MKGRLLLTTLYPLESVTPTEIENVPEPVGVQPRLAELDEEQPGGRPCHVILYPPDPPNAVVENVTD